MSEWLNLTQDPAREYVTVYQRKGDYHHFSLGKRDNMKINMSLFREPTTITTSELANIPWVKALIQAARKDRVRLEPQAETGALSIKDFNILLKIRVALKPFEDVTYE